VTVVREHIFTVTEHGSPVQVDCTECGALVRVIRVDEGSSGPGVSLGEMSREVEACGLHFVEKTSGSLLICLGPLQPPLLNQSRVRRFFQILRSKEA
jgi:hypothetical protein